MPYATEGEMFRSPEFKKGIADRITQDTWGRGLPKIIGRRTGDLYEIVALYEDGHEELCSYSRGDISFRPMADGTIEGHWQELFSSDCLVYGQDESTVTSILEERRADLERLHNEWILTQSDDDYMD